MVIPVILSGGVGSRLWPLSRSDLPKQFLPLTGEHSLFQQAIKRCSITLPAAKDLLVVCHETHQFLVQDQLQELEAAQSCQLLLEPCGRNTAPAVGMAALHALAIYGDVPLWIMPADHVLEDGEVLTAAIKVAEEAAHAGAIVCFGMTPDSPATGYGYIQIGVVQQAGQAVDILRFVEKPERSVAEQMLVDGGYYWNSGMLMVKPSVILEELKKYQSQLHQALTALYPSVVREGNIARVPQASYQKLASLSIDYGVLEHTRLGKVVTCSSAWSDVGSWSSLMAALPKDSQGNVTQGNVLTKEVTNSLLLSSKRVVAGVGLQDTIVVETADAILVADRSQSEVVKDIVADLEASGAPEGTQNLKCNRPWGSYETLTLGPRYRVKHIQVHPGASLSLQKHMHRAEHWVIVAGTAEVQRDDETMVLSENESSYIPIGAVHRLTNIGKIPLELIEVQTGSYLEEDDIIRLDDVYGRVTEDANK